jgi:drug/metabolite transporter (DMT)-like permease
LASASSAPIIRAITARSGLHGPAGSVAIAAARMTLAALLVAPGLIRARRRGETMPHFTPTLVAGVALALHFSAWISSLSFTTMAASTVIVTTNPVWVAVVTAVTERRWPARAALYGLGLSLAGAVVLAWGDANAGRAVASDPLLGDALALVGAWAATAYYLASRRAQSSGAALSVSAPAVYTVAACALFPFALALGTLPPLLAPKVVGWVLALALVPQLVGHTAFHWAMRHRSPTMVTTVILLEPVGAALIGAVAFGERPSRATLVGAALLLLGVWRTSSAER